MKQFRTHVGIAAPLIIDNVDTDQIIPSREMKRISKSGLSEGLFAGWRYEYSGTEKTGLQEDFVLNLPAFADASVLLGGRNFGCGSSREHAVWALHDFGFRVVIAASFGRIFYRNCARSGLLAIELPEEQVAIIAEQTTKDPQNNLVTVDLERSVVETPAGDTFAFEVSAADREMLLNGLDYIDYSLQYQDDIQAFEEKDKKARRWAYL